MADDDSDRPMSDDEVISSAHEILDQLRDRWRASGLPSSVLSHQMIGSGVTELINERGVEAALEVLRELVSEIERTVSRRAN